MSACVRVGASVILPRLPLERGADLRLLTAGLRQSGLQPWAQHTAQNAAGTAAVERGAWDSKDYA